MSKKPLKKPYGKPLDAPGFEKKYGYSASFTLRQITWIRSHEYPQSFLRDIVDKAMEVERKSKLTPKQLEAEEYEKDRQEQLRIFIEEERAEAHKLGISVDELTRRKREQYKKDSAQADKLGITVMELREKRKKNE